MDKAVAEYLLLIIILSTLILIYCIYIINDERKKLNIIKALYHIQQI